MSLKHFLAFSVFIFVFVANIQAQLPFTRGNSPYSRYGMGDLYSLSFSPVAANGLGAAYNSYNDINLVNPASLSELRHIAFDIGAYYKHSWLRENSTAKTAEANDGNLSYLSVAFPIWRPWKFEKDTLRRAPKIHWGMSLGLFPHSTIGYSVQVIRKLDNIGDVLYTYEGSGSRFLVNWGNGWKYKGFSFGANVSFLFGKTSTAALENFIDTVYTVTYNNETVRSQYATGVLWDLGLQYEHVFKNKKEDVNALSNRDVHLTIGAYGNAGSRLSTQNNEITRRYASYYGSDTIENVDLQKGTIAIPGKIGAGVSVSRDYAWMFGVNFQQDFWGKYNNSEAPMQMANAYLFSVGGEYWFFYGDPNKQQRDIYKKIVARLGGYYGQDPRIVVSDNASYQLDKYGITFGLGIPVGTKDAQDGEFHPLLLNLGFEWGSIGNKALIRENFFKVNLGFTLTGDKWFIRPKYR